MVNYCFQLHYPSYHNTNAFIMGQWKTPVILVTSNQCRNLRLIGHISINLFKSIKTASSFFSNHNWCNGSSFTISLISTFWTENQWSILQKRSIWTAKLCATFKKVSSTHYILTLHTTVHTTYNMLLHTTYYILHTTYYIPYTIIVSNMYSVFISHSLFRKPQVGIHSFWHFWYQLFTHKPQSCCIVTQTKNTLHPEVDRRNDPLYRIFPSIRNHNNSSYSAPVNLFLQTEWKSFPSLCLSLWFLCPTQPVVIDYFVMLLVWIEHLQLQRN